MGLLALKQLQEIIQIRLEKVQHPVRPGAADCKHYLRTGQCGYGSNCYYNHPPPLLAPELPERINIDIQAKATPLELRADERRDETEPISMAKKRLHEKTHETVQYPVRPGAVDCKHYLRTGQCGYGSTCYYNHPPPPRLAPELPERINIDSPAKATPLELRADERIDETESGSMAKKRARTIPDSPEYVGDDAFAGYKPVRFVEGEENIGWQRMEAEEIVEEQRERQSILLQRRLAQDNVQRENIELLQRREAEKETVEERRLREMHPQVLENAEEERRRDIQRQRNEAKLRLDQDIEERRQREAEERRKDIERQRREFRMKLEQMTPTVKFNEAIDIGELMGFKEGNGI
ncbi:unnamed protein product [Microthlaspi erraticum]|uniref:C3H1-type domain-containing protein n=1 Tax=Microthlaspi erraticum TaxID=1685480 RepID=A0A6D2J0E1_9BRAS|nr:unnamed protein product [Microthlaspi erraticum]